MVDIDIDKKFFSARSYFVAYMQAKQGSLEKAKILSDWDAFSLEWLETLGTIEDIEIAVVTFPKKGLATTIALTKLTSLICERGLNFSMENFN